MLKFQLVKCQKFADIATLKGGLLRHLEIGMRCFGGKVTLSKLHILPQFFSNLLTDDTVAAKQFRKNLSKYNASFIMTSFSADRDCTNTGFFTTYNIQGQCYHRIGTLLPL